MIAGTEHEKVIAGTKHVIAGTAVIAGMIAGTEHARKSDSGDRARTRVIAGTEHGQDRGRGDRALPAGVMIEGTEYSGRCGKWAWDIARASFPGTEHGSERGSERGDRALKGGDRDRGDRALGRGVSAGTEHISAVAEHARPFECNRAMASGIALRLSRGQSTRVVLNAIWAKACGIALRTRQTSRLCPLGRSLIHTFVASLQFFSDADPRFWMVCSPIPRRAAPGTRSKPRNDANTDSPRESADEDPVGVDPHGVD